MRLAVSLLVFGMALATPSYAEKASPSPSPKQEKSDKKADKEKGDKEKKEDSEGGGDFDVPIPVNVPVKGIKIPHYGPDGKLLMMFDAEVARKLDDTHVEMENLKIDAYGDDGKKFYIELPRSTFNLENRILTGNERVLVRRDDFEITGDAGEFQTKTRYAKVIGNVKMIIFSTDNLE